MLIRVGIIQGLFGLGLNKLVFQDGNFALINDSGIRALASDFGPVEGAGDLHAKIRGQEIVYTIDEFGILVGFCPVSEWQGPEISKKGLDWSGYGQSQKGVEARILPGSTMFIIDPSKLPCDCGLALGEVRDHDDRVWENDKIHERRE